MKRYKREWGWRFSDGRATGSGCHLRPGPGRLVSRLDQKRGAAARPERLGPQSEGWNGEAVFAGDAKAVDEMLAACREGPPQAVVAEVEIEPWSGALQPGFQQLPSA